MGLLLISSSALGIFFIFDWTQVNIISPNIRTCYLHGRFTYGKHCYAQEISTLIKPLGVGVWWIPGNEGHKSLSLLFYYVLLSDTVIWASNKLGNLLSLTSISNSDTCIHGCLIYFFTLYLNATIALVAVFSTILYLSDEFFLTWSHSRFKAGV